MGTGYFKKRVDAGLCGYCEAPRDVGKICRDCWFKMVALNHLGTRTLGPELQQIWDRQGGRCTYTGAHLVPGPKGDGNASLDHKVPPCRGGANELDNFQWVLWEVNRMKSDMLEVEFFDLCEIILSKRGQKTNVSTGA